MLANASSQDLRSAADRQAVGAIFDDVYIADAALEIHQRAAAMPIEERFQYLANWVLSGIDHDTIRVALDFAPTDPVQQNVSEPRAQSRVQTGADQVSPAIDLVATAKQLGRLDELHKHLADTDVQGDEQKRCRLALLAIVNIARDKPTVAQKNLEQLSRLVLAGSHTRFSQRWPETLAIWNAVQSAATRDAVSDMLHHIFLKQVRPGIRSGSEAWRLQMAALIGTQGNLAFDSVNGERVSFTSDSPLTLWQPASRSTALTRGQGYPVARWRLSSARIDSLGSHGVDYLYFGIPLRGNFEIECDVSGPGWPDSNMFVAGLWVHLSHKFNACRIGDHREELSSPTIKPRLSKNRIWLRYRAIVRDGVLSVSFNGRKVHQQSLTDNYDPWVAIRSTFHNHGAVRNLRITGDPQIPDELQLSTSPNLSEWVPYFGDSIGGRGSQWCQTGNASNGGIITGRFTPQIPEGSGQESLLQYHRPMLEDGTIEYDFYYRADEIQAHPALDCLAFMLKPDGVHLHSITDGAYDRTGLDPQNIQVRANERRGPDQLPLNADAWNHMKVSLSGNTLFLNLNGQIVYEHILSPSNQRTFGLFYYADQAEARIRNVIWRGDWPRTLPPIPEQELAGELTEFLDDDLAKLTAVREYDFSLDGLPPDEFTVFDDRQPFVMAEGADGLRMDRDGVDTSLSLHRLSVAPRCIVRGDFDVTASFIRFRASAAKESKNTTCSVLLSANLSDRQRTSGFVVLRFLRRPRKTDHQLLRATVGRREDNQSRNIGFGEIPYDGEGGTLRLARRGKQIYYLIAEQGSSYFRMIGEETWSDADVTAEGIRIQTQIAGLGSGSVVWTQLNIHAAEIIDLPSEERLQIIAALQQQLTGDLPMHALEFDGVTNYVTVPSIVYDGSHPITLETYVTHDRFGSVVIGDTQQSGLALGVPGTRYNMHAWNGKNYTPTKSSFPPVPSIRVHLAGTFDGDTLTLFVNGRLMKSLPLGGQFASSGFPLTIGASPSPNAAGFDYPFDGIIDGIRVSKTVRYTKDFEPPLRMESDDDTLALYDFSEGQGLKLSDSSGHEHHGLIRGATWVTDTATRYRAAAGLAKFRRQSVDVLVQTLSHQNPLVRLEAAAALGVIGSTAKQAVPVLRLLYEDDDQRVREAAKEANARIESISSPK